MKEENKNLIIFMLSYFGAVSPLAFIMQYIDSNIYYKEDITLKLLAILYLGITILFLNLSIIYYQKINLKE